jgi:dienelactone hydrolase
MRRSPRPLSSILFSASLLAGSSAMAPPAPPLWGTLHAGPHTVGFRSTWQRDHGRRYDIVFDDKTHYASRKSPRPILVNTWYPAKPVEQSAPMRHRDYLAIGSDDPQLARLAAKLVDYERGVVCKELMGKKPDELSDADRRLLDGFWETPTASHRDAPPLDGKFPLVIYHAGGGSSYEDNAVLCEFLASHGYVVLGCPFMNAQGEDFNIDGHENSASDFEFLIRYASSLPDVDWQHIGIVGHSAGAQAALYFLARRGSAVDAVVSLDTTQDYYTFATKFWEDLVRLVLDNVNSMDGPLLMAANDHAIFQLADALVKSDRYYLLTHALDHNNFIAQSLAQKMIECRAKPADRDLEKAYATARAQYEVICDQVLRFFDAQLKGQAGRLEPVAEASAADAPGGSRPYLLHVPRGVAGPEPFRADSPTPPTPRQIRDLMKRAGVGPALDLLKRHHQKAPGAPVFHESLAYALVDEFLEQGRIPDAIAVHRAYLIFDPGRARTYFRMGLSYEKYGMKDRAIDHFKKAILFDPADHEAAEHLKKLQESNAPPPSP